MYVGGELAGSSASFILTLIQIEFQLTERTKNGRERKKKKKRERESVEATKSVENININLPPLNVLQNIRNQLTFFLELNICGEVQKLFCAFAFSLVSNLDCLPD